VLASLALLWPSPRDRYALSAVMQLYLTVIKMSVLCEAMLDPLRLS